MRSDKIEERVELGENWAPKRNWINLFILCALTCPIGFFAVRFLVKLIVRWSRNGLTFFEAALILLGFMMVFRFYRWIVQKSI